MKLSVVVLTYNQEETVKRALDSILSQEHPYSMEIIVADDASSDKTPDIIAEYATKYPNIIKPILRKKNLGLIGNYTNALSRCKGEYIAGCAGDDYWLPGKIYKQISYMDSHPKIGMSYTKAKVFDTLSQAFVKSLDGNKDNSLEKLIINNHVPAISIIMRSSFIERFDDEIKPLTHNWMMEDYPRVLYAAGRMELGFIPIETCVYNLWPTSITHSSDIQKNLRFEANVYDIRFFFANYFKCNRRTINRIKSGAWLLGITAAKKGYPEIKVLKTSIFEALRGSVKNTVKGLLMMVKI